LRPEGLEPPTIGSEDREEKLVNPGNIGIYGDSEGSLTPQLTPESRNTGQGEPAPLPPDLAEVLAVWSTLPEHIRRAIVALVKTAKP